MKLLIKNGRLVFPVTGTVVLQDVLVENGVISLMERGLDAASALDLCITNKTFDPYEKTLIRDVIAARIPKNLDRAKVFPG